MSTRGMTKAELREVFKEGAEEHFEGNEYITKEEADRIRQRIEKVEEHSYSVDELKQVLPPELWTEVQEHLSDPGDGGLPEGDVEKAMPRTPFSPDPGYTEDVKTDDDSGALDLFYDEVDE